MKIEYDKEVDALYIRIQGKDVARTQEVSDGVNLDFDGEGRLIGLEVLGASRGYSSSDIFNLSTENLILNVYITAQQLLMLLIVFPVIALTPAFKGEVIAFYSTITLIYNFWVYFTFFKINKLFQVVKVLLALVCAYLLQFIINYGIYLFIGDKLKGL